MTNPLLPGATIGVFGSGQLGRMMALAARTLGYRIHCFSPDQNSPTGQVADQETSAPYEDLDAVRRFVQHVDVVTFEFENVASEVAEIALEEGVPVRPGGSVLHTTQHRLREKRFLAASGLPVTPFVEVNSLAELQNAVAQLGYPAILKTAAFGYDGKGQARINNAREIEAAWQAIGGTAAILESFVPFVCEVSVVAARGSDGSYVDYGLIENIHERHILDLSIAPARVSPDLAPRASELARAVLEKLEVIGVLCVECFVTANGDLLINELAPRPHNSGHLTIDAAVTSQFEQQVRAVCGLPLGDPTLLRPAVMANLLGDRWQAGEPNWAAALQQPQVKLHLYGKAQWRLGRKMGHLTALADKVDVALERAIAARNAL
jgi:5-(carboxyamino)imidazole ribonucleotide synthase